MVLNRFIDACIWTATDHVVCGCLNPSLRGTGGEHRTGGRSPKKPRGGGCLRAVAPNRLQLPRRTHRPQRHTTGRGWHKPPLPLRALTGPYPFKMLWGSGGRGLVQGPGPTGYPGPLRPPSPARSYPERQATGYPAGRAGVRDGSFKAWSPEGSHTSTARVLRPPARVKGKGTPPQHGGVGDSSGDGGLRQAMRTDHTQTPSRTHPNTPP